MFKFGTQHNKKIEEIIDLLPQNGKVLDLGCGMGGNSIFLAEKGFKVTCIDKDKEAISHIKEQNPNINALHGDILKFNFPNDKYDLVLILNVLNFFSLENAVLIINKIIDSLKIGGFLYLQVFSKDDPGNKNDNKSVCFFDKEELKGFLTGLKIIELEDFKMKDDHPPEGEHEHSIIRILARK